MQLNEKEEDVTSSNESLSGSDCSTESTNSETSPDDSVVNDVQCEEDGVNDAKDNKDVPPTNDNHASDNKTVTDSRYDGIMARIRDPHL